MNTRLYIGLLLMSSISAEKEDYVLAPYRLDGASVLIPRNFRNERIGYTFKKASQNSARSSEQEMLKFESFRVNIDPFSKFINADREILTNMIRAYAAKSQLQSFHVDTADVEADISSFRLESDSLIYYLGTMRWKRNMLTCKIIANSATDIEKTLRDLLESASDEPTGPAGADGSKRYWLKNTFSIAIKSDYEFVESADEFVDNFPKANIQITVGPAENNWEQWVHDGDDRFKKTLKPLRFERQKRLIEESATEFTIAERDQKAVKYWIRKGKLRLSPTKTIFVYLRENAGSDFGKMYWEKIVNSIKPAEWIPI